ncbi:MAG: hypothetical protein ACM3PY_09375 [Omnitrophica WOR_2 bacterium]
MSIIGIVIGFCFVCFLIVVILFLIAPRGYEDDHGFHFESDVEKRSQRVNRYRDSRIERHQHTVVTKNPAA